MLQRHSPRGIRGMRYLHNTQTETQNRGCSIGDNRHGTFSIFLLHDNSDKNIPKHNKFLNSRKSYAMLGSPQRLCRWVSSGLCRLGRHKAFNLHTFRPCINSPCKVTFRFWAFFSYGLHICPTRRKWGGDGAQCYFAIYKPLQG